MVYLSLRIAFCLFNISSVNPTWITSPLFRAGNNKVITILTGAGSAPRFTFER